MFLGRGFILHKEGVLLQTRCVSDERAHFLRTTSKKKRNHCTAKMIFSFFKKKYIN